VHHPKKTRLVFSTERIAKLATGIMRFALKSIRALVAVIYQASRIEASARNECGEMGDLCGLKALKTP
jgi:hypothetical protein